MELIWLIFPIPKDARTQKMLNSVPGQQKEKTYRVIVRGLTEAQGKELTGKYPGSNMEEEN